MMFDGLRQRNGLRCARASPDRQSGVKSAYHSAWPTLKAAQVLGPRERADDISETPSLDRLGSLRPRSLRLILPPVFRPAAQVLSLEGMNRLNPIDPTLPRLRRGSSISGTALERHSRNTAAESWADGIRALEREVASR